MKTCILVGIGMGNPATLTQEARDAIQNAPLVAGATRMLASVADIMRGKTLATYDSAAIATAFADYADADVPPCAVLSGDTGFYSGAAALRARLEADGWQVQTLPGITTAQYVAARLGEPWQDWHLASAHGTDCNLGIALSYAPKTFFLTGGTITVRTIAQFLHDHDCAATLFVGSHLSYRGVPAASGGRALRTSADASLPDGNAFGGAPIPNAKPRPWSGQNGSLNSVTYHGAFLLPPIPNASATETIFSGTPSEILSRADYDESLACVLVVRDMPVLPRAALPDEFFIRNTEAATDGAQKLVPMTKQFVRAAILSTLSVSDGETVWDIGAGTGAVSIDLAHTAHCAVYAIEAQELACALIRKNRAKAGALNLEIICARAPDALESLPAPDAVFIGGSEGALLPILRAVYQKNPSARVVTTCVTLETLSDLQTAARALNLDYNAVQLSVTQTKRAGDYHLMTAQNPVWVVSLNAQAT